MRPPRRKAPVRRGTQPVPALERQPRGPQHLGPAAAERQSPGSVTPSPAWPPVIATPSVGVPFHRTSEYLRLVGRGNAEFVVERGGAHAILTAQELLLML